jgi:tetratricopeptide (TPR) repeat protein
LNDDLSDSETEIILGYGRSIGKAWSLGAALKVQRQSLAGFSDSGAGLDLGVLVRPLQAAGGESDFAESLTLGLALRNAVEPSIRLDQESVSDPAGIRLGFAYMHRLGQKVSVLLASDLEKTRDMDSRMHAGLELNFMSTLAMRMGVNHGTLAAGTGVRWRDLTVDYMFEDNALESVHRVGLVLTFGPTTEESRLAHLVAEEEDLQSRLNQAFERRNRSRIDHLLAQARQSIESGRYTEALEILTMVDVLAPGEPGVRGLQALAFRSRGLELEATGDYAGAIVALGRALSLQPADGEAAAALERVRAASDRQAARSAEIRQMLDDALGAFAAGDLLAARTAFAAVLAVEPDDQEAGFMLQRTEEAIRTRAESLVQQARLLAQAGQLEQAEAALQQARELDPEVRGMSSVVDLLAKIRLEETEAARRQERAARAVAARAADQGSTGSDSGSVPVAAPQTRPSLTEAQKRDMADLYRRGITAIEEGRNDDAVRYWELVWSADPNYQQVAEYLKREYLARGMEAFAAGRLHDAVGDWEKALEVDPTDERAIGYLERAREQMSRIQEILGES